MTSITVTLADPATSAEFRRDATLFLHEHGWEPHVAQKLGEIRFCFLCEEDEQAKFRMLMRLFRQRFGIGA